MSRKNKLMLAAAIAAVALLIGSGVARCTLERADTDEAKDAIEAVEGNRSGSETSAPYEEEPAIQDDVEEPGGNDIDSLIGSSWQSQDDPTRTLAIVKGAFVETKDGQTDVTYWTVDSEDNKDDTIAAIILASKSMADAAAPVTLTVGMEGASEMLSCDALASKYVRVQAGERKLAFDGVTGKLAESMGADAASIEAAVATRAAAISPSAERARWDAEVWCDFANDVATTTFTLEDGASTIISVTRAADGTLEAL